MLAFDVGVHRVNWDLLFHRKLAVDTGAQGWARHLVVDDEVIPGLFTIFSHDKTPAHAVLGGQNILQQSANGDLEFIPEIKVVDRPLCPAGAPRPSWPTSRCTHRTNSFILLQLLDV